MTFLAGGIINMLFFKNHFGMVISTVIALFLSLFMAISVYPLNHMAFDICSLIKGWGTSFLVIMLTTMLLPLKMWGDMLAGKIGLKEGTLPFGLFSNLVPTFFYNLFATAIATAVNVFYNPMIPAEAQMGAFTGTVLYDLPITFVIAYVLSLILERIAFKVAVNSVPNYVPEDK